jgi:hypothetical protein
MILGFVNYIQSWLWAIQFFYLVYRLLENCLDSNVESLPLTDVPRIYGRLAQSLSRAEKLSTACGVR